MYRQQLHAGYGALRSDCCGHAPSAAHPLQIARLQTAVKKGFTNQNRAIKNLFTGPNQIEDIASMMNKLEKGDLKLRVRALEAERALGRVQVRGAVTGDGAAVTEPKATYRSWANPPHSASNKSKDTCIIVWLSVVETYSLHSTVVSGLFHAQLEVVGTVLSAQLVLEHTWSLVCL